MSEMYERLTTHFDQHYTLPGRGGSKDLTYITGEQCISRLNEVLGFDCWEFTIKEHGVNAEADEVWVLGELVVWSNSAGVSIELKDGMGMMAKAVRRQQFGSQKIKRIKSSGVPLEIGFDLKGAATDALKKCATLIGVGLYLSNKEEHQAPAAADPTPIKAERSYEEVWQEPPSGEPQTGCADCGAAITPWKRKDGTEWSAGRVAEYARSKYGRVLCWNCGRKAAG